MSSRTNASTTATAHAALALSVFAACLGAPALAHAGTSGSVSLTSDYIFRGVSQTNQEPALQGGIEYAADSGFYVGAWGSNVSWLSDTVVVGDDISSSLELDVSAGYRGKAGEIFAYDVGALYYWYPGDYPGGFNSPNTAEFYVGATVTPVETVALGLKYSHALTDLFGYADSDGSGYLDASVNWTFQPGWTLNLHGGKQWIKNNEAFEYTDWKLGVTKAFDNGFSIAAAYTDTDAEEALYTNAHGNNIAEDAFTLTLTKAF
ncbi:MULTISPECIES: TorF family putative porin [unclassified Lysobacter]|uniref:TorF family putative porin n=1 Tax=unclassified Lysobacter TaxID=2635362 RepID=UPI0009EC741C|nr:MULTISPECIES: TorF family putative porin [unclassified Lysobacter]